MKKKTLARIRQYVRFANEFERFLNTPRGVVFDDAEESNFWIDSRGHRMWNNYDLTFHSSSGEDLRSEYEEQQKGWIL